MKSGSQLKIEHYIIQNTLGVGAFGKVKLAIHELTGIQVAIKIINKKKIKQSKMISKIKREIRLLRYFDHPNIIKLYEVLDTTTDIFVIMEYIAGGELFDLIAKQGKIPENEARNIFIQILSGVQYCHQNLVAHRDLKPENILIEENGVVKIADFGLSNLMIDGKCLKTSCGTPNYAAPEVISAKQYCGTEIDTWSCGVILYALLAGYLPFDEDVIPQLFKKIKEADYTVPKHFSANAKDLISRIFQADPQKRIKFHEIQFHPWILQNNHENLDIILMSRPIQEKQIDEDIIKRIKNMNLNLHNMSEDRIRECILKRKQLSFVISYQMLLNEKNKLQHNQVKKKENLIFNGVHKIYQDSIKDDNNFFMNFFKKPFEDEVANDWIYGVSYSLPPKDIMKGIYECLGTLDTAITIKSLDFKIKCYHKNLQTFTAFSNQLEFDNDEYIQDDQLSFKHINLQNYSSQNKFNSSNIDFKSEHNKFSKKNLVFIIQIYALPNKIDHYVDIQLSRGHPIVFLEFCHKFISLLNKLLINQS